MANSVLRDRTGFDWPLGQIVVTVPGTPVGIMSVVDSTSANDPNNLTPGGTAAADEYTVRCNQILFQAFKVGLGPPALTPNTGNIYIVRKGAGGGSGNKTDTGVIVAVLTPGQSITLGSPAMNRNDISPYRYSIDADTANDACQVTLIIG